MATAAMNCEQSTFVSSTKNNKMDAMDMSAMDMSDPAMAHMHHSMDANNPAQNQHRTVDCCKTMGHCLMGGCSIASTNVSIAFLLSKIDSAIEAFYFGMIPTPFVSSLYRPPIFC